MMKPSHALKAGIIVSIAVVILFVFSAAAPAMSSNQANAFTSTQANLLPNPQLDSNVTWSTFNSTWGDLEYYNGTAHKNLTAEPSTLYKNPITIDTADLVAKGTLQNNEIAGKYWDSTTNTTYGANSGVNIGTVAKEGTFSTDKAKEIYITSNTTKASNTQYYLKTPTASITQYPSSNLEYDYITAGYELHGPALTGAEACIMVINQTDYKTIATTGVNEPFYISENLKEIEQQTHIGLNITGKGKSNCIGIHIMFTIPKTTTDNQYNLTLNQYAFTDFAVPLGTNATGKQVYGSIGNAQLLKFNPTTPMTVINSGYTTAVSQSLQNITTQQSEISGNPTYVEQVTYQGNYLLPSAPDLSYSSSVISERFSVNASQTTVLDINGISLLNIIAGKNGTVTLMTVNPNQKTTLIQITEYTSSQWESVSGPPGFFSVNGILYYFDEIVLGIIAVVGLAGGAAVARTRSLRRVK